ncbi:Myb-like DNA-binding domain protein [Mortierella alpina]|nr:Myb-like DNA-binding domain protein [Mortierella alpina]
MPGLLPSCFSSSSSTSVVGYSTPANPPNSSPAVYSRSSEAQLKESHQQPGRHCDQPVLGSHYHQDELLFDLRQRGIPWKKISATLKRPVAACYSRYYRHLDPFLVDAVEGDAEGAESIKEAVEASQRILEANVYGAVLKRAREDISLPLPYDVQGPWTAADRDRLESLVAAQTPWSMIAKELQRNQHSCKEKWARIQRSQRETKRQSKRVRSEQWIRLYKEGFSPHHRDQLMRAVEKQLAARGSFPISTVDPLGFLHVDNNHSQGQDTSHAFQGPDVTSESIDWDAISRSLNNKFPPVRLRSIYHELAATKLIWTPEEDERLIRAVVRLGPPELQPRIWSMIKEAFGDVIRTSDDYRSRWRELDMPPLDREWDLSEKVKFWRRWMEFQTSGSLFTTASNDSDTSAPTTDTPVDETTLPAPARPATYEMWDQIAEGLEYRHARDCQLYFERTTARFPRDRDLFRYLTTELANVYLKPRKVYWSAESSRLLVATVNSFLQKNKIVDWRFVAKAFNGRYTVDQCESRWRYWSHKQDPRPDQDQEQQQDQQRHQDHQHDDGQRELNTQGEIHMDKVENQDIADGDERRLWSDKELEQLKKGVGEYGHQWARIRDQLLPHRSVQALRERYWRNQAKKTGRFSEKERSLLETAIETFGEGADWELIAGHVPGRTASQCRKNWNYSRTHHIQRQDEPWTDQDKELLKNAVARFGSKRWTLISEFVVGKTPDQCRNEWRKKLDPAVTKKGLWSSKELDILMERVVTLMARNEEQEMRQVAENPARNDASPENVGQKQQGPVFVDPMPRFKGKRKVDWKEVARGIEGRTPEECRVQFRVRRALYRIQGDF